MSQKKKRLGTLNLKSMDVKSMSNLKGKDSASFETSWTSTVTFSMEVEASYETESYTEFYH